MIPNQPWTSLLLLLLEVVVLQILTVLCLTTDKLARFDITELQTMLQLHVIYNARAVRVRARLLFKMLLFHLNALVTGILVG